MLELPKEKRMKKETIEANDLKFREKLQGLRSQLVSRHQSNPKKRNPYIFIKVAIPLVLVILGAAYLTAQKIQSYPTVSAPVSDQLQITESKHSDPPEQNPGEQIQPGKNTPEFENPRFSHAQDPLGAGPGKASPKLAGPLSASENKSVETNVSIPVIENSEAKKTPVKIFSSKKADKITSKTSDEEQTGSTSELKKSPVLQRVKISRMVTCSGVKSRMPVEPRSVFSLDKHRNAHVWMEVHSEAVPYTLKHVYYHEGEKYCEVPLRIKFLRMRTWSNITLKNPTFIGSWRVDIVAEDGTVLLKKTFEVIAGS